MRLPVFVPKTGYVQRIVRGRAAGCGVVQHANETRCNTGTAGASYAQGQVPYSAGNTGTAQVQVLYSAAKFANKIQKALWLRGAMLYRLAN